jgi:threonine dehydratase
VSLQDDVLAAEARIGPHVRVTPVEESPTLGETGRGRAFLKLESLQITGSFKLRGAMNKLLSLTAGEKQRGVVTASSGNHGTAVACGLKTIGCRGVIFLPENASPVKMANIRSFGAEIRTYGRDSGVTEIHARRYAEERGLVYVSPYNDPVIVAGQGTIGAELARQIDRIDVLYVALGGGGLVSGIAGYLKSAGGGAGGLEVVACSPENSAVMHHSIRAGRILEMESKPTLSDGTAGAVEPGAITFDLCKRYVDRYLLVSEREIAEAMRLVIEKHHTLIEGAAGVAVAGYLKDRERAPGLSAAIVLCGANIALERLREVLAGGKPSSGRPARGGPGRGRSVSGPARRSPRRPARRRRARGRR